MLPQEIVEPRVKDIREVSPVPPPGFRPFEWPQAEWNNNGDVNRDSGLQFVASWSAKIAVVSTSSRTIVTDTGGEFSGFHHGASRYYRFGSLYPDFARPDPFSRNYNPDGGQSTAVVDVSVYRHGRPEPQ